MMVVALSSMLFCKRTNFARPSADMGDVPSMARQAAITAIKSFLVPVADITVSRSHTIAFTIKSLVFKASFQTSWDELDVAVDATAFLAVI